MKKLYLLVLVLFLGWLSIVGAQDFGFLNSNIWFSKSNFFVGEEVRIYTAIFNGSDMDVDGLVGFFDNGEKIGEANFSLARGGRIQDVWIDWTPSIGEHLISARIVSARGSDGNQSTVLNNQSSGELNVYIDLDTDKDGIGNREDDDDDGDGLSDEDELALGTDPLLRDTDGDGLIDGEDPSPLIFNLDKKDDVEIGEGNTLSIEGLANMVSNEETGEKVEEVATNAFNAVEVFRQKQVDGLTAKKQVLDEELKMVEAEDLDQRAENATERNKGANQINEAVGDDIFYLTSEEAGLPKLTLSRIFKLMYWGFISAMLFVFENKIAFYIVFGLLGLKLLFMIFRRIFRRAY